MASTHRAANDRRRAWKVAGRVCLAGVLVAVLFCVEWDAAQRAEFDPVPAGPVGELIFQWGSFLVLAGGFVLRRWRWLLLPVVPLAAVSVLVLLNVPDQPATIEPYLRWDARDWWTSDLPIGLAIDVTTLAVGCALRRVPWGRLRTHYRESFLWRPKGGNAM